MLHYKFLLYITLHRLIEKICRLGVCQWQVAIVTHHPLLQFSAREHVHISSTLRKKNTPARYPDSVAAVVLFFFLKNEVLPGSD